MGFLKNWSKRKIAKNTFETDMTYTDKKGTHVERVLLKRSTSFMGDWHRIYPPINEDDSVNYGNLILGGKKNFMRLIIYLAIALLIAYWVYGTLGSGREYLNGQKYVIMEKPLFDKYCQGYASSELVNLDNYNNLSLIRSIKNG